MKHLKEEKKYKKSILKNVVLSLIIGASLIACGNKKNLNLPLPNEPWVVKQLKIDIRPLTPHETLDVVEYIELLEAGYPDYQSPLEPPPPKSPPPPLKESELPL